MRQWISLVENDGKRDGVEWFNHGFGLFSTSVTMLRKKIASGEIVPIEKSYPVKELVERLFGDAASDYEFGSQDFEDRMSFDIMGPPVTRSKMAAIPDDKMDEPTLFVMWNTDDAMRIIGLPMSNPTNKEYTQIVDGNHRLIRRYLAGDTGMVKCQFVPYEDALKCSFNRGTNMAAMKKQRGL